MLSEDKIIDLIKGRSLSNFNQKKNIVGIGDDCAVIPKNNNNSYLISTDALAENTHFILDRITPEDLAYKSIAINISDIAAMGGRASFLFISVGISNRINDKWLKKFIDAINKNSKLFGVAVLGGDTFKAEKEFFINITVIGEALNKNIKYRNKANDSDVIALSGNIGDSKLGLNFILENNDASYTNYFIKKHYQPKIYHEEGFFLSAKNSVTGMMDVSDGLKTDLIKFCKASNIGAEIDLNKIPISSKLQKYFSEKIKAKLFACSGGEDYVLLLTIKARYFKVLQKSYRNKFKKNIYPIGHLSNKISSVKFIDKNIDLTFDIPNGFKHF